MNVESQDEAKDEVSRHRQIGFDSLNWWPRVREEALRNTHTDTAPPTQMQMPTGRRRAFYFDIRPTRMTSALVNKAGRSRWCVRVHALSVIHLTPPTLFTPARSQGGISIQDVYGKLAKQLELII